MGDGGETYISSAPVRTLIYNHSAAPLSSKAFSMASLSLVYLYISIYIKIYIYQFSFDVLQTQGIQLPAIHNITETKAKISNRYRFK